MVNHAKEKSLLSQARKILISCFTVENGTLITPLLLFFHNWFLFAQKHTVLLIILQRIASTALCSQQLMQEGRVEKIQT